MKAWILRSGVLGVCAAAIGIGIVALAADHADSPSVATNPKMDITDLYAFQDGNNLVLVMDVNPLSGPVATEDLRFATTGAYYFHVDSDGDVSTDEKTYTVQFADKSDGTEWIRVRGTGHGSGSTDDIVGQVNTSADAATPRTVSSGDSAVKIFAGPRDDPFFFSLLGNGIDYKGFTTCTNAGGCFLGVCDRSPGGTGCLSGGAAAPYPSNSVDTLAGFNVSAIVIEVPLTDFASSSLGIWASTAS